MWRLFGASVTRGGAGGRAGAAADAARGGAGGDGAAESEAAEARDTLFEYYRVLTTLDSRVAVKEALGLKFRWTDSFKAAKSATHGTAAWEASSVPFNVAALFTQEAVACASDGDSDSGLKQAANLFCSAAGVIKQLKLI